MKARAFIGSSVEGLGIAYAVQQNLLHDVESTVWDQGVFQLSATTIESLSQTLESSDFGIFVFSPDDMVKIREKESPAVRDNVLFELGLFIGKLGRERVFFLMPMNEDVHLATDLLGITPGKFDSNRSDGSMQAATGPACHQIRQQIKKLGPLRPQTDHGEIPPGKVTEPEAAKEDKLDRDWVDDILAGQFAEAKKALAVELDGKSGTEATQLQSFIHFCELKLGEADGIKKLRDLGRFYRGSAADLVEVAIVCRLADLADDAIAILENADDSVKNTDAVILELAHCHNKNGDFDEAIAVLRNAPVVTTDNLILLADLLENKGQHGEAMEAIHSAYLLNPTSDSVQFKYARLANDRVENEGLIALYFFRSLTQRHPNNSTYWGYLANTCVALDLPDSALSFYRKAEETGQEPESEWIVSNIGNLLSNKGFPTEAIGYFERSLAINPKSEYAHNRISGALKAKDLEHKSFLAKCNAGLKLVRQRTNKDGSPPERPELLQGLLGE